MDTLVLVGNALVRGSLATILLFAGITKLLNPASSIKTLQNYAILPKAFTPFFGILLPVIEICLSFGLLLPATTAVAGLGAMCLFMLFGIGTILVLRQGRVVDCGCFGSMQTSKVNKYTLIRIVLLIIAASGVLFSGKILTQQFLSEKLIWVVFISLVCVLASIILIFLQPQKHKSAKSVISSEKRDEVTFSRRTILKLTALGGLITLLPMQKVAAGTCCKCQYIDHYDQFYCCTFYRYHHHYWRCYNACTGQRGSWHYASATTCDTCECAVPPCDYYHPPVNQCCYANECSCCSECPC